MGKIKALSLLLSIWIVTSCQFNQSVHYNLTTGAQVRGNGIRCDNIQIKIHGKVEKRNEFVYGEKVNLVFEDIRGLTEINNKTYPILSMQIIKNEKDTVLSYLNLLKNTVDGIELAPLKLKANFVAALPYKTDEKYKVVVTIRDRKGDGKFTYTLPFTVKANDLLSIKSNGIEYKHIYLWNQTLKKLVVDKKINPDHSFILILEGINGLEQKEGRVYPIFSIDLIDDNGVKIISNPNMLRGYATKGIHSENLKRQLVAKLTFTNTDGKINNPCILRARLKDKHSSKEIAIKTELIVN